MPVYGSNNKVDNYISDEDYSGDFGKIYFIIVIMIFSEKITHYLIIKTSIYYHHMYL